MCFTHPARNREPGPAPTGLSALPAYIHFTYHGFLGGYLTTLSAAVSMGSLTSDVHLLLDLIATCNLTTSPVGVSGNKGLQVHDRYVTFNYLSPDPFHPHGEADWPLRPITALFCFVFGNQEPEAVPRRSGSLMSCQRTVQLYCNWRVDSEGIEPSSDA